VPQEFNESPTTAFTMPSSKMQRCLRTFPAFRPTDNFHPEIFRENESTNGTKTALESSQKISASPEVKMTLRIRRGGQ